MQPRSTERKLTVVSYHLAYQLETPTGIYRAGLEVWIVKRSGNQFTINLAPKPRRPILATVEREMLGLRSRDSRPKGAAPLAPCGTPAAYRRHRARLEDPCDQCETMWRRYQTAYRLRTGHTVTVKVDVDVLAELYLAADGSAQEMVEGALSDEIMGAVVARYDDPDRAAN
ncbi:hypothetical protein [Williamsia sp.]|uniref:hypothetical protein n=1 Tax=Williamsia sp. TaxID=1872085 RepID=UPI002F940F25